MTIFDCLHRQKDWFLDVFSALLLLVLIVGVSCGADNGYTTLAGNNDVPSSISPPLPPHLRHNITQLTKLDCAMRQLAVKYAGRILLDKNETTASSSSSSDSFTTEQRYDDDQDWIIWVQQQVHDALRIDALCGTQFVPSESSSTSQDKDGVDGNIRNNYNKDDDEGASDQLKLAKLKQECYPSSNGQQEQAALCLLVLPSSSPSSSDDNTSRNEHKSAEEFSNSTTEVLLTIMELHYR